MDESDGVLSDSEAGNEQTQRERSEGAAQVEGHDSDELSECSEGVELHGEDISTDDDVSNTNNNNSHNTTTEMDAELDYDEEQNEVISQQQQQQLQNSNNNETQRETKGARSEVEARLSSEEGRVESRADSGLVENQAGLNWVSDDDGDQDEEIDKSGKDSEKKPKPSENATEEGNKERDYREPSEEGEIIDLEEGELKSDSDEDDLALAGVRRAEKSDVIAPKEDTLSSTRVGTNRTFVARLNSPPPPLLHHQPQPGIHQPRQWYDQDPQYGGVCKYYLRGMCTWGRDCKYAHTREQSDPSMGPPVQSSSSELTWTSSGSPRVVSNRGGRTDIGRSSFRESVHSRVTFTNYGNQSDEFVGGAYSNVTGSAGFNANIGNNPRDAVMTSQESAWERGLKQARELVIKASKKREEEPDFEKKRLVLVPSDEIDRTRVTDEDSDEDSTSRRFAAQKIPSQTAPVYERNVSASRGGGNLSVNMRVETSRKVRRYFDDAAGTNDMSSGSGMRYRGDDRKEPTNAYNASLSSTIPPRRIPSLIDGIREGRIVDPLKGAAAGAPVGSSRIVDPTKDLGPQVIYPSARPTSAGDLGPQVLYPNGRPNTVGGNRRRAAIDRDRRGTRIRDVSPATDRSPRSNSSLSPRYSSRSPTSSSYKRRVYHHHTGDTDRGALNKRSNIHGPIAAGGDQIRDPWDRSRVKRGRSHELASTTLGSVLQKARRRDELRGKGSKRGHGMDSEEDGSPISSVSRSSSRRSSLSESSRTTSNSRASSRDISRAAREISRTNTPNNSAMNPLSRPPASSIAASAVPLKSVIDDDGSIRTTDLSSFRIPKKKRMLSPQSASGSRNDMVAMKRPKRQLTNVYERSAVNKRAANIAMRGDVSSARGFASVAHSSCRQGGMNRSREDMMVGKGAEKRFIAGTKENISSDEGSSSSSTSTTSSEEDDDDDNEPAAYRRKKLKNRKDDDGLPTEGIPLSPDANAEDVSSDDTSSEGEAEAADGEENNNGYVEKKRASDKNDKERDGGDNGTVSDNDSNGEGDYVDNGDEEENESDEDKSVAHSSSHSISPLDANQRNKVASKTMDSANERRGIDFSGNRMNDVINDDDYVDNEAEKEERRAELLRQLKCVEEAIARKRSKPLA